MDGSIVVPLYGPAPWHQHTSYRLVSTCIAARLSVDMADCPICLSPVDSLTRWGRHSA